MVVSSKDAISEFINTLFGKDRDGSIVIFTLPKTEAYWFSANENNNISELASTLANKRQNVHVNLGLQNKDAALKEWQNKNPDKNYPNTRGNENTVIGLPGFWMDIDIKGPNHKETNLPETIEDAKELAYSFPLKPTLIVFSGGGLHVYWLFKDIWFINNDIERQKAKNLSRKLQSFFIEEAKKKNWKLDFTGDLMRMLRPPGTINWKKEPVLVEIIEKDDKRRYSIEDFDAILKDTNTQKEITNSNPAKLKPIFENCAWLRHTKDDSPTLSEPEWYAMLSIVARCENGEETVHEWSKPYQGYSAEQTEKKMRQALDSAGPRTCSNISEITGGIYCSDCKHSGKITSPIVLGNKYQIFLSKAEALQIAQEAVSAVVNGNAGAHLTPESVTAFAHLKQLDLSEFARLKDSIKKTGATIAPFNDAIKNVKVVTQTDQCQLTSNQAGHLLNDAPAPNIIIPPDYTISNKGTYRLHWQDDEQIETLIAHNPILITKKYKDIENGREIVFLDWNNNGKWYGCYVEREVMADSKKIVQLSAEGFPVHSVNAKDIVKYLADMEAANSAIIPKSLISSTLGWQGKKGELGFLLHDLFITEHENTEKTEVKFRGLTDGDEQIAAGFHQEGDYKAWKNAIAVIKDYPRVLLLFYAALSTVLLEPLGCSNFVVELANRTSTGKTTALRVAASLWGCPDEKRSASIIGSWDSTKVWLERASAILYSLPLFLDDTKRAKYSRLVAEMIYSVANGRGRGRGNVKSLAVTKSWRTVLFSTGETPLLYFSNDGGTRGRVLEIIGKPFGESSEYTRKVVTELNMSLKQNYGFLGPHFTLFVLDHKDKWAEWKKEFREIEACYAQKYSGEVAGRLAEYAAIINIAAKLVHESIDLPWEYTDPVESLWEDIVSETKDATGEQAALQHVVSWAYANSERFEGREAKNLDGTTRVPATGWAGKWDSEDDWNYIAFLPSVLKQILKDAEYDPEAIIRGWRDHKWLDLRDDKRSTRQLTFRDKVTWLVPIRRKAIAFLYSNPVVLDDQQKEIYKMDGSYYNYEEDINNTIC